MRSSISGSCAAGRMTVSTPLERGDDPGGRAGGPATGGGHPASFQGGEHPPAVRGQPGEDREVDRLGQLRRCPDPPGPDRARPATPPPPVTQVGPHREVPGDRAQVPRCHDEHRVARLHERLPRDDRRAVQVQHERASRQGQGVQDVGDDRGLGRPGPCTVGAEHRARSPPGQQRQHVRPGDLASRVGEVQPPHPVGTLEPQQDVDATRGAVEVHQGGRGPARELPGERGRERRGTAALRVPPPRRPRARGAGTGGDRRPGR